MLEIRWLDTKTITEVESLLQTKGILSRDERIESLNPAGEGNMNVTMRAQIIDRGTGVGRSLIVKQSRPFVAKYDSIPAPLERVEFEAGFYRFAIGHPAISKAMPRLLAWFPEEYALVLEDLGQASDATTLYSDAKGQGLESLVRELLNWLAELHLVSRGKTRVDQFANRRLRALNHQHIFDLPFRNPAILDLNAVCPGLEEASLAVRASETLRVACLELGDVYLADGDCLLHGDFYPGSWLLTETGPRVIDPEFCFIGPAEFDYGVLLAHMELIGFSDGRQMIEGMVTRMDGSHSMDLIERFAAVEILRRLLGVAQLPLNFALATRMQLIETAAKRLT